MNNRVRILSISDDDGLRFSRELLLTRDGYETTSVTSSAALSLLSARPFDIALICRSVDPERAVAVTELLRNQNPAIQIVCVAPIEDRHDSRDADFEVASGPQPLLDAIRALCGQRNASRKTCFEVSHQG